MNNLTKILLTLTAVATPLLSCDPYKEGRELVANADTTKVVFTGNPSISGYYNQENIPYHLKNQVTYHTYLDSVKSWNNLGDFGNIPSGKKLLLPNLDGK